MSRRVLAVTGTRAEFGLLRPVLMGIDAERGLELEVVVTGTHLLPPASTHREVEAAYPDAGRVEMQRAGAIGRAADAEALARGVAGFARRFAVAAPDIVLVLGDRIEAFAAASAAAVAGIRIAHLHGGDLAEGVADDALRHAITKLAHIHLPATEASANRIERMGEAPERVHCVGSPAIDGIAAYPPLGDDAFAALGSPRVVVLVHPVGDDDAVERERTHRLVEQCRRRGAVLALHPNHDPGRNGIVQALEALATEDDVVVHAHLPRDDFVGVLRRVHLIAGNSSAGIIEATALGVRTLDVGSRQAGRECADHVVRCGTWDAEDLRSSLESAWHAEPGGAHPYGDGHAGTRTATVLAEFDESEHPIRKRNAY